MVTLKTPRELELMRTAGGIVAEALAWVESAVRPGVSTQHLNDGVEAIIRERGGTPEFLGYRGFPASICASINEEVVHGIPSPDRVLRDGDIIGVDVGVRYKNYIGDSARTFSVGEVDETSQRLLEATRKSLEAALEAARAGVRLVEVSRAVERTAREYGFGVVREYAGHGLGSQMHEDPQILNYHDPDGRFNDLVLRAGMTLAIEPMLNAGTWRTEVLEDGWTVVTRDRKRSAHFEHSIGITENGVQVLTELGS
jgi:methionyl aminopeptidase